MAVEGYSSADWSAAGRTLEGSYSPTQLFTGEDDIKTEAATFATSQTIAVLTLLSYNATGELVPHDADGVGSLGVVAAIAAADIDTTGGAAMGPIYTGGCFNPDLLVWDADLTTYKLKQAALAGSGIRIKRLL